MYIYRQTPKCAVSIANKLRPADAFHPLRSHQRYWTSSHLVLLITSTLSVTLTDTGDAQLSRGREGGKVRLPFLFFSTSFHSHLRWIPRIFNPTVCIYQIVTQKILFIYFVSFWITRLFLKQNMLQILL